MNLDNNNSSHTEVQASPLHHLPDNAFNKLKKSRWRRPLQILLWLIGVFFAVVLLGLLLGPNLIRSQAEKQIGEQLGRHTTIGDLKLNLLSGEVTVLDATVFETDKTTPFVSFKRFYVNAASWASLFRLSPVLDEITLEAPRVNLVRTDATRFNFSDIVDKILAKPASEGKTHFSLNNIRLIDGEVHYQDTYSAAKPEHALTSINVAVPFVSNLDYAADLFIKPELNALLNSSPIGAKAETKPFESDKETHLQLSIDKLNLPDYLNLLPFNMASKLASAQLNSDLDISFKQDADKQQIHAKGNVILDDLDWQQADGQGLLKLQQIKVDINDIDVASQQVMLQRIDLKQPEIQLVRNSQGQLNWLNTIEQIQKNAQKKSDARPDATPATTSASEKNKSNQPWAITLKELAIDGGSTSWTDETTSPTFHKTLQQINLSVKELDTGKPKAIPISLSANTAADEKITHEGLVNPFALTGSGTIGLAQIRIADAMPYLNPILNNPLEDGRLDAELHYELGKVNDKLNVVLKDSSASLIKLKIKSGSQPIIPVATKTVVTKNKTPGKAGANTQPDSHNQLDLGQLQVKGITFDLVKQNFVADSVTLTSTQLAVLRDEQGQINWTKLVKSADKPTPNTATTASANQTPVTPWQWLVKSVDISQTAINFDDLSVGKNRPDNKNIHGVRLRLEPVTLSVKNLSSQSELIDLALDTSLNQKGKLRIKGNAQLSPFSTRLDIDAQTLDLQPFTPYVDPFLNIDIASGELNAKGNVHFDAASESIKNGKKLIHPMAVAYKGQASLAKLRALDKVNSADFLKFKSLAFSNIDFAMPGSNPAQSMAINVGDISLNDYYARIILNANGRINLRDIAAKPESNVSITTPDPRTAEEVRQEKEAAASEKPAATGKPLIRIGQIGLKKGSINFTDNFIKPNYTVDLTGIEGKISKLASDSDTPADMLLQGRVSNDAPVVIEGRLNPLAANLFVDIGASAKGIELTQLTPYAAKYAGYAIDKGKLSVDLKYKVENGQLNADNKVYLDQLTFGKKIDSPDATKLPVLLAVSLLKDRNGVIDINLPVSGSLSDPQFSIGGIIFKVIINLLTKAIMSPFSLLASAFGGGGEELSYITFAPGLAMLEDSAPKKLEPIAKALLDRPALKMELTGRADPGSDLPALRKEYLNSEIRKLKLKDLSRQGKLADEDAEKSLAISDEERAGYIEKIYKASKFDKPKNAIGFAKGLPTEEMSKLIEDNHAVGENDLQQLANQRASNIKQWLEEKGKVPTERLFLIAGKTKTEAEEGKETNKTAPANRVDFTLK